MSERRRRLAFNSLRIVVSALLLWWVFVTVDIAELVKLARGANPAWLVLAYALGASSVVVRAARWLVLLRTVGARPAFGRLVYLYFVGQFFSSFLPTGFAGDAVKVMEIGGSVERSEAAGTVIVDRLSGFISLFLIALFALPFSSGLVPAPLTWLVAGVSAAVLGGTLLLFQGRVLRALTRPLPKPVALDGGGFLARTYAAIERCGRRALLLAVGISTFFNLQWMLAAMALARGLHIPVLFGHIVLFTPLAVTALLFPFAISGLGVREGLYVALYTQPGVDLTPAAATALGLATFTLDLMNGLIGGGLYLLAGARGLTSERIELER